MPRAKRTNKPLPQMRHRVTGRAKHTNTNPNGFPFRVLCREVYPVTPRTAAALSAVWDIALAQPTESCQNEPSSIAA